MSHFKTNGVLDVMWFSLGGEGDEGSHVKGVLCMSVLLIPHPLAGFWIHVAHSLFDSILTITPRLFIIH